MVLGLRLLVLKPFVWYMFQPMMKLLVWKLSLVGELNSKKWSSLCHLREN